MNSKKILLVAVISLGLVYILQNTAFAAFQYPMLEGIPGFYGKGDASTDFPGLVLAIYKFGIWTVGIAGFFMLVIGGFMYMSSAGNTSIAGSAKTLVTDALLGIVAAMSAYLFLYVINPDLTQIKITFPEITTFETMSASNPQGHTDCLDCISVADICKENPCSLNKTLAEKLKPVLSNHGARVTEGYPATVKHLDSCHGNGTCADVNFTNESDKGNVQKVKNLYDALAAAGLKPVYEARKEDCVKYTAVGVYCHPYPTMTYPSFHVNM